MNSGEWAARGGCAEGQVLKLTRAKWRSGENGDFRATSVGMWVREQ